jgi:MFS family permease
MKKDWKSYLSCCLIMLIHTGLNSVATAAMPSLKTYYQTDLTNIILGASVCCVSAFVAIFFADLVIQRLRPKWTLALGSACGFIFCLILSLSKNLYSFYIGCFFAGLLIAWGTYTTCNVYIRRMNPEKRGILTSAMITVGLIGSASFQVLTGILLKQGTVPSCYRVMALISLAAIGINLLGVEDIRAESQETNKKTGKNPGGFRLLLKNPIFLMMALVVLMGPAYVSIFSSLFSSILQAKGMDTAQSSAYLSAYTFLGGVMALATGKIFDRFQIKTYVILLYGAYFFGCLTAIIWNQKGGPALLILMIVAYAISMPIGSFYNLASGPLFGNMALAANTKLMSIAYFGSTVLLPLFSKIYTKKGFLYLWMVMIGIALVCMILSLLAIKFRTKEQNIK